MSGRRVASYFLLGLLISLWPPATADDKTVQEVEIQLDRVRLQRLAKQLGFTKYYKLNREQRSVSVAIFDVDFGGYLEKLGVTLPSDTEFVPVEGVETKIVSVHGTVMAEILTALVTNSLKSSNVTLKLYLYDSSGYTKFKNAISDVIAKQIPVVLHSAVREYGSNWTGDGFYNREVSRATQAGVIWVNAAGNFAQTTYNHPIYRVNKDGWVILSGENQALPVRCAPPLKKQKFCNIRLVLSWNDFKDDPPLGSDKDLDLVLTDDTLNIVATSNLKQVKEKAFQPGESLYPREIVTAELNPGLYYARVKRRSDNFTGSDRLRITVEGAGVAFGLKDPNESILPPADHKEVITVGASDSPASSASLKMQKPELLVPSTVGKSDVAVLQGSSPAAAIAAAGIALLKANKPALSRSGILELLQDTTVVGGGLTTYQLGFGPIDGNCFETYKGPAPVQAYVREALTRGGVLVHTTAGLKMVFAEDPLAIFKVSSRRSENDIVLLTPEGLTLFNRSKLPDLAFMPASVELLQLPLGTEICGGAPKELHASRTKKSFYLPKVY